MVDWSFHSAVASLSFRPETFLGGQWQIRRRAIVPILIFVLLIVAGVLAYISISWRLIEAFNSRARRLLDAIQSNTKDH